MRHRRPLLGSFLTAALLALAAPAPAVLIASGDGSGNTSAPADDFGFANVGDRDGLSGVYVGNGWVLTADHVGAGPIDLQGESYAPVEGSGVQLETAPDEPADLFLFRIARDPGLPALAIAEAAPSVGETLRAAGNGRNRGGATSWLGLQGWSYGKGRTLRWGTNRIAEAGREDAMGGRVTRTFRTEFDALPSTAHEFQSVPGDSGGGVFVALDGDWVLAGIQLAILGYQGQPAQTALFGNSTLHADLSFYSDAIADVVSVAACDDGVDNDGDGYVDTEDPGCASASDAFETDASLVCDDGLDNDGDGKADSADPGCGFPSAPTEAPACDDGVDNDGDGKVDVAEDPQCSSAADGSEEASGCGLVGLEPLPLYLCAQLRRGRRRGGARRAPRMRGRRPAPAV